MENNRDFIKGGLPLSSKDFVNPDNIRAKKSRLLAALDNISKVHDEKMYSAMTDNSAEANNAAISTTLDMVGSDLTQPTPEYNPNEYATESTLGSIFDQLPNAFEQPATEVVSTDTDTTALFENVDSSSMFQNVDNSEFTAPSEDNSAEFDAFNPISMEDSPTPYQMDENEQQESPQFQDVNSGDARDFEHSEFNQPEQTEEYQQSNGNYGDPEYVVDDSKVGKRARSKSSMSGDAQKGRYVAWLAYIVFFIPLLFAGKNSFVRHHANEGLCVNILDVLGIGLLLISQKITNDLESVKMALLVCGLLGVIVLCITIFSRIILIIGALLGKKTEAPLFGKVTFIKS